MVTSSVASGGAQVAVGPHGAITMPRGVIAGGDVSQSRVFQFRLGGLLVLLAAVAIFAAAISATTTYVIATPEPDQGFADDGADGLGAGPIPVSAVPAEAVEAVQSHRFCWQDGATGCPVVEAERAPERAISGRTYDDVVCLVLEYQNFRGLSGVISVVAVRDTLLWTMVEDGQDLFLSLGCTNYQLD